MSDMRDFASALAAAVTVDTETIVLKATARSLAKLIQTKYAAALELDTDLRMGVREVLRLTEPKWSGR